MDYKPEQPRAMSAPLSYEQLLIDALWTSVILGGPPPAGAEIPRGTVLPVLVVVRQWNNALDWRELMHYRRAVEGHIQGMLIRPYCGAGIVSLGEQRDLAMIPAASERGMPLKIARICGELIQVCQTELLCEVSCYIGEVTDPDGLEDMTDRLVAMDSENVAEVPLRFLASACGSGGDLRQSMEQGAVMLRNDRFDDFLEYIYQILDGEKQRLTSEQLNHFNQDMLQLLYSVMNERSVPAHTLFQRPEHIQMFRDASVSINNTVTWLFTAVTVLSEALRERYESQNYTEQTKTFIQTHIRESFTRQDIADYVHVSQNHLARLFRRETGMSIAEYTLRERMKLAVKLLVETELSVGEIALRTGYENYSYFLTLFRRTTGLTPSAYRTKYGAKAEERKDNHE